MAWNFSLTDRGADVLDPGQKVTVTYTVTVDDGHGGATSQDVVVTVTGGFDFDSDPAGVAGSEINLGLTQVAGVSNMAVALRARRSTGRWPAPCTTRMGRGPRKPAIFRR